MGSRQTTAPASVTAAAAAVAAAAGTTAGLVEQGITVAHSGHANPPSPSLFLSFILNSFSSIFPPYSAWALRACWLTTLTLTISPMYSSPAALALFPSIWQVLCNILILAKKCNRVFFHPLGYGEC